MQVAKSPGTKRVAIVPGTRFLTFHIHCQPVFRQGPTQNSKPLTQQKNSPPLKKIEELSEEELLTPPLELQLVILNLWPPELCDDTRFLLACKENRSWDTKMSGEKKRLNREGKGRL